MTRDEHRKACAKSLMDGAAEAGLIGFQTKDNTTGLAVFLAALDALHGLALVNPIEATEEMVEAGMAVLGPTMKPIVAEEVFHSMSHAGDLTNEPEEKL